MSGAVKQLPRCVLHSLPLASLAQKQKVKVAHFLAITILLFVFTTIWKLSRKQGLARSPISGLLAVCEPFAKCPCRSLCLLCLKSKVRADLAHAPVKSGIYWEQASGDTLSGWAEGIAILTPTRNQLTEALAIRKASAWGSLQKRKTDAEMASVS